MRQLRGDERENGEYGNDSADQIQINRVGSFSDSVEEPRQFDRPWKEAEKYRNEVQRQQQEIKAERFRSVSFHCSNGASDNVSTNSDPEKFAVGLNQRRNRP